MRLALTALALATVLLAQHATLYPLSVGNRWEYVNDAGGKKILEVTGKDIIGGRNWFRMTESSPQSKEVYQHQVGLDPHDKVWEWRGLIAPALLLAPGVGPGLDYAVERPCAKSARNTRLAVDLVVYFTNTCADQGLLWERYRDGIGLIGWRSLAVLGPMEYHLVRARVNGRVIK